MGMFDYVRCETPLPPEAAHLQDNKFQTKDFDWPYLDSYRITSDGRLVKEQYEECVVPEKERPYWGTKHWPGFAAVGMIHRKPAGDKDLELHGKLRFYEYLQQAEEWWEFEAKFTDGKLVEIVCTGKPETESA